MAKTYTSTGVVQPVSDTDPEGEHYVVLRIGPFKDRKAAQRKLTDFTRGEVNPE